MNIFDAGYPFITAYLKGEEAHFITSQHVDRLLRASDAAEAIEVIKDTDVGKYLGNYLIGNFDEMDERLWLYLNANLRWVRFFKLVPGKLLRLMDAYLARYDVLNIKSCVLGISSGKKAKLIPLGTIHELGLSEGLLRATDVDAVGRILEQCGLSSYAAVLKGYKIDGRVESRLVTEAQIDRVYFGNLTQIARKMPDSGTLMRAIGTMMDMTNLNVIFRAVAGSLGVKRAEYTIGDGYLINSNDINQLLALKLQDVTDRLPYAYRKVASDVVNAVERTKSITAIDEIIDREEFRLLRDILSLKLMSPLIIIWYLILKETEVRNVRLIFKFMFDHHPLEELKSFLVIPS